MTHDIISGGIAALAEQTDNGLLVNGVALGENDITEGMSGKRTRWPKKTLEGAAELLVGKPITKQLGEKHVGAEQTDDGLIVDGNVPLESKVGEVTQAKYRDGVGLLWQGEIKDPEMADKVEQGLAEVSPVLAREVQPVEGEEGLFEATGISGVRDLGLVANGAAPSNFVQPGSAAAMTAEALAQAFDESAESEAEAPDDDDPSGGEGQSTGDTGLTAYMDPDDITDAEFELLAAARQMDSPAVIEEEDAERLPEADELLSAADEHDDPKVIDESEHEALQGNIDTVRSVLEGALVERTELKESTVEALAFDALCGEFENEDGEFEVEALVQDPETGDLPEVTDPDDDTGLEALQTPIEADDRTEAVEALQSLHGQYSRAGWEANAKQVAEDLESLGVEV